MTGSEVLSLQQVSAHPPGVDNQHLKAAGHNFSSGNVRHHFPAAGHEGNERQNGHSCLSPAPGPLAQLTPCRLGRSPQEKAGPSHGCSAPQVTAGEETTGEDSSTGAPGHLLASGIFSPQRGVRRRPAPAAPQAGGGREGLRERALVLSDGTTWVLKTAARDELKVLNLCPGLALPLLYIEW